MSDTNQRAKRAACIQRALEDTIFPIPIRNGVTVRIQGLPHDLTSVEANKLAAVIMAYVER